MTTRNDCTHFDGPSRWLECSCQGGIVRSPNHPHAGWRDKTKDYGGN